METTEFSVIVLSNKVSESILKNSFKKLWNPEQQYLLALYY